MTAPGFRRQGIFKKLLLAAREEIRSRLIPDMLLICEQASKSGVACARATGATYNFSEYKMNLGQHVAEPLALPANLQLRPAQPEDVSLLVKMDELCLSLIHI